MTFTQQSQKVQTFDREFNTQKKGEKNKKYFLNLKKSRQKKKTLNKLDVNVKEITNTVDILQEEVKFNKSPGSDGLTVQFYSYFWNILGPLLIKVLNEGYKKIRISIYPKN